LTKTYKLFTNHGTTVVYKWWYTYLVVRQVRETILI